MAEFPYYCFFPGDFAAKTHHLTTFEKGVYRQLLDCAWNTADCSLPNNDILLARFAGIRPAQWRKMKPIIMPFWDVYGNQITNKRLLVERAKCVVLRSRARLGGVASAASGAAAKALKTNNPPSTQVQPKFNSSSTQVPLPISIPIEEGDTRVSLVNGIAADPPAKRKQFPIQKAFDHYNIAADQFGLPVAEVLTAERRRKIRVRLEEHGLEGWDRMLCKIENSEFLQGKNNRGWRASLDFFLQPSSFNKTIEGGYADED